MRTRTMSAAFVAATALAAGALITTGTDESAPAAAVVADRAVPADARYEKAGADEPGPDETSSQPEPSAPAAVHDTVGGDTPPAPPARGGEGGLGGVDPEGLVPPGLDITAFPGAGVPEQPPARPAFEGAGSFSPGPGCAHQCIASGVAYARGFGAELVVETKVPADVFVSVIADTTGDGDWDFSEFEWSPGEVTAHSWSLDHLDGGQRYHVMVAATDEHDDTSYAWGEFTTLSERTVEVTVHGADIRGGSTNIESTKPWLAFAGGDLDPYDFGATWTYRDVDRDVDVALVIARRWGAEICEGTHADLFEPPYGSDDDSCVAWNTAVGTVDLDRIPQGRSRWTTHSFTAPVETPDGAGGALPPGYGQPRFFHAAADVSFTVGYR